MSLSDLRMRLLSFVSFAAVALLQGILASPIKEESSVSVEVAENVVCDGSHFIVSVQRYDFFRGKGHQADCITGRTM